MPRHVKLSKTIKFITIKLAGKANIDTSPSLTLGNKSINCLIDMLLKGPQNPAMIDKNITTNTILLCSFKKYHINGKSVFGNFVSSIIFFNPKNYFLTACAQLYLDIIWCFMQIRSIHR